MFYFVRTNRLFKLFYPQCIWDIKTDEKIIYLTFDDGPHPEATPFVLEELKKYNAKATFFCIGKNVAEFYDIYRNILAEGHGVGNHTYNHLNGWRTGDKEYMDDIFKAKKIIDSNLFRPPYGRIKRFQLKQLEGRRFDMRTIMWTVLSGDFDEMVTPDECYHTVIKHVDKGSIVVFHDSEKAFPRLRSVLPRALQYFSEKGYSFEKINL